MDDEMINRLTPILLKHNPQTKIGAIIVLIELLQAMREPTEKMIDAGIEIGPARSPTSYYQAMIDAITND